MNEAVMPWTNFPVRGIIYANTMSQAAAKQTFGECARTMMKQRGIMVQQI